MKISIDTRRITLNCKKKEHFSTEHYFSCLFFIVLYSLESQLLYFCYNTNTSLSVMGNRKI